MKSLKVQLARFIIAGVSAVTTDLVSYYALLNILNVATAKGVSFILGTIVAYLVNKYWTFEKPDYKTDEVIRFITLYSITLGVNVLTNSSVLYILPGFTLLAFLTATGMSTVLNFIGQKWWVFR